jgi:RluA family pseudouridine synthase
VISGRGIDISETLNFQLERKTGQKIFTVHRLDRDTSGVIIFAKNAFTHRLFSQQFERRETEKIYLAVVSGLMIGTGCIDAPVYEFGSGRMGIDSRGKSSRTKYNVLKQFVDSSLLEVFPETGRRHQIRVHLYSVGHPILGDANYGNPRPVGNIARLMLHAHRLTLTLPGGSRKTFTGEPDSKWNEIMKSLEPGIVK